MSYWEAFYLFTMAKKAPALMDDSTELRDIALIVLPDFLVFLLDCPFLML